MHISAVVFLWVGLAFGILGLLAPVLIPRPNLNWLAGCWASAFAYVIALHG
jgi:hypothetical protein